MTRDVSAGFGERNCNRLAQAGRSAGDERDTTFKLELIENHPRKESSFAAFAA